MLFAILQKYDFSSKSQLNPATFFCCSVVCDTAKVRFFKQITTQPRDDAARAALFAILQKYDFSSKSQLKLYDDISELRCLRYCKSTIFQANHNWLSLPPYGQWRCAWSSSSAVGRGRCVSCLFGTNHLFLLEILVATNKVLSLQSISNGVGMGHKSPVPPRGRFSAALFLFLLFSHRKSRRSLFCHLIIEVVLTFNGSINWVEFIFFVW